MFDTGWIRRRLLIALLPAVLFAAAPAGEAIQVYLQLLDGTKLVGTLAEHDDTKLTVKVATKTRTVAWADVRPMSAYLLKRRLVDLTKAESHWQLGQFLLNAGEKAQADKEFDLACKIDPAYTKRPRAATAEPVKRPPVGGPAKSEAAEAKPTKYIKATPERAAAVRKRAAEWAERIRTTITPKLHLIETDHFLIYSTWDRGSDGGLKRSCEGMYAALCKQFAIPATENIWVGKCPVYVFWQRENYQKFALEVSGVAKDNPSMLDAGGYQHGDGRGGCYIVLVNRRNRTQFHSTLVHEGSHAFLGRYRTNRYIDTWINEGVAEYMAAEVVPGSWERRLYIRTTKKILEDKTDISFIFEGWSLDSRNYGLAQSLVRYLIARDTKAFIQLIELIKQGKSDDEALKTAYDLTKEQLAKDWRVASAKAFGMR